MSKFKMPSTKSFRERLASSVSQGKGNKDVLMALDYSLAHPSSLADAQAQAKRAEAKRHATAKITLPLGQHESGS